MDPKKSRKRARSQPQPPPILETHPENLSSADSEDEDVLLKTGRVPRKWYDDFKHVGYDIEAKTVLKKAQDSKLDELIKRSEDPNWWRTIRDELNNQEVVLTDQQLDLLKRVRTSRFADPAIEQADYSVEYDWDGSFPLQAGPIAKRTFLPSKWERIKVNKLVQAIKLGRIDLNRKEKKKQEQEVLADIWAESEDKQDLTRNLPQIAAPKLKLPGHAESYNPSEEFLLSKEEEEEWRKKDPEDRELDFIPKKFDSLRKVYGYDRFIKERFERCLDLYLCPRIRKKKLNIDPDSLIPKLPKPSELRPFPTMQNMSYKGHENRVRGLAVHHSGAFLASCDEAGLVIIWDVNTSRKLQTLQFEGANFSIDWSNDTRCGLLAVCNESRTILLNPDCLPSGNYQANQLAIEESQQSHEKATSKLLTWVFFAKDSEEYAQGQRIEITMTAAVKHVSFHEKGDYFATVSPNASQQNDIVLVHSLHKGASQRPFNKSKAGIQKVYFHPSKPFLFILTQKNTYIYNLQKQILAKKLVSGAHWNSCLAIHPKGDNVLVGSYDKRICWFDLDLANTPYKTLRYHEKAIRQVVFHKKYPLFASCSDDGSVNIFHATVHNDLMQNALIVPLKILNGHSVKEDLGVLDVKFHPNQPWIFSSGADHKIILWT